MSVPQMGNVHLTTAQRNVVADLLPKLTDCLKLNEKNSRTISFTAKELESIRQKAEASCSHAENDMMRNSLRHVVGNLAESLQVAHDAGTKRVLLPMASVSDIATIPGELFAKFQTSFYSDPRDAAFKAMGVE